MKPSEGEEFCKTDENKDLPAKKNLLARKWDERMNLLQNKYSGFRARQMQKDVEKIVQTNKLLQEQYIISPVETIYNNKEKEDTQESNNDSKIKNWLSLPFEILYPFFSREESKQ